MYVSVSWIISNLPQHGGGVPSQSPESSCRGLVDVTITSITVDATSGNQDVSYDITLDVDCGGCSAAEISQAESDALATAASSLTTSITTGAFADAFEAELAASGTTDCGNPPTCTNLVTSAGDATLTGLGLVSGLRVVYVYNSTKISFLTFLF